MRILGAKLGLEIDQKSIPEGMKTCKRTREQSKAYWRRLKPSGARLWLEWVGYGGVNPRTGMDPASRAGIPSDPQKTNFQDTPKHTLDLANGNGLGLGHWLFGHGLGLGQWLFGL